jgi:hypothetical protein
MFKFPAGSVLACTCAAIPSCAAVRQGITHQAALKARKKPRKVTRTGYLRGDCEKNARFRRQPLARRMEGLSQIERRRFGQASAGALDTIRA